MTHWEILAPIKFCKSDNMQKYFHLVSNITKEKPAHSVCVRERGRGVPFSEFKADGKMFIPTIDLYWRNSLRVIHSIQLHQNIITMQLSLIFYNIGDMHIWNPKRLNNNGDQNVRIIEMI